MNRNRSSRRLQQRDYEHLLELPDYLINDVGLSRPRIVEAMRRRSR